MMNILPLVLEGQLVRLEPLSLGHVESLSRIGLDPELWKYTTARISSRKEMEGYIQTALRWQEEGTALPFAIVDKPSGTYVGSTRYANIEHTHRKLEIGWTWVAHPWQRTGVNTETKLLLLTHAFESLGCVRVEFKTDSLNNQSRAALLRLGAKEEGILRNHMIVQNRRYRHSVYYSIIDSEWPQVKERLRELVTTLPTHR